jgi:hypothetical protein
MQNDKSVGAGRRKPRLPVQSHFFIQQRFWSVSTHLAGALSQIGWGPRGNSRDFISHEEKAWAFAETVVNWRKRLAL